MYEKLLIAFKDSDHSLGKVTELLLAMSGHERALAPLKQAVSDASTSEQEAKALTALSKAREGITNIGRDDEVGLT